MAPFFFRKLLCLLYLLRVNLLTALFQNKRSDLSCVVTNKRNVSSHLRHSKFRLWHRFEFEFALTGGLSKQLSVLMAFFLATVQQYFYIIALLLNWYCKIDQYTYVRACVRVCVLSQWTRQTAVVRVSRHNLNSTHIRSCTRNTPFNVHLVNVIYYCSSANTVQKQICPTMLCWLGHSKRFLAFNLGYIIQHNIISKEGLRVRK